MPNRILRDWTDSETVDLLSVYAERFFTRLIMKVDDYGRYNANIKILKSTLFPLKTDVRESDISRWLKECEQSGLIVLYNIASKDFLQIENFRQHLRQKTEKYPSPNSNEVQPHSTCNADEVHPQSEKKGNEVETETEEREAQAPTRTHEENESFKRFQEWVKSNAPRVNQLKQPFTIDEFLKLKQKLANETIRELLISMHNYKPLLSKSVSAYLTVLKWSKKETESNNSEKASPTNGRYNFSKNGLINQ